MSRSRIPTQAMNRKREEQRLPLRPAPQAALARIATGTPATGPQSRGAAGEGCTYNFLRARESPRTEYAAAGGRFLWSAAKTGKFGLPAAGPAAASTLVTSARDDVAGLPNRTTRPSYLPRHDKRLRAKYEKESDIVEWREAGRQRFAGCAKCRDQGLPSPPLQALVPAVARRRGRQEEPLLDMRASVHSALTASLVRAAG